MALAVAKPAAAKRKAETFMVGNDLEKMTGSVTGGRKTAKRRFPPFCEKNHRRFGQTDELKKPHSR